MNPDDLKPSVHFYGPGGCGEGEDVSLEFRNVTCPLCLYQMRERGVDV